MAGNDIETLAETVTFGSRVSKWMGRDRLLLALVFTDIVGSTELNDAIKDERMNTVRRAHFARSRKLIKAYGGCEIKTVGDAFLVAFRSTDKALDYAIGGWQFNAVETWTTGLPFTPGYTNCGSDEDVSGECRANVVGNYSVANQGQAGWFASCSSVMTTNGQICGPWQRPQPGQIGNVGRDAMYGPHFWQLDFSAFKEIPIRERFKLQIRAESYNFLNHVNLGQPTTTVDSPNTAGKIFGTAGTYLPEIWQLGMRLQF